MTRDEALALIDDHRMAMYTPLYKSLRDYILSSIPAPTVEVVWVNDEEHGSEFVATDHTRARFDRYVCALAKADPHQDLSVDQIVDDAAELYAAANAKWKQMQKNSDEVKVDSDEQ